MVIQLLSMLAIAWRIGSIRIASIAVVANMIRDNSNWIDLIAVDAFVIAVIVAKIEVIAVVTTALELLSKRVK